jgi:hypothetical protein
MDYIELTPFDERGSNVESTKTKKPAEPKLISVEQLAPHPDSGQGDPEPADTEDGRPTSKAEVKTDGKSKPRRRRRRSGRREPTTNAAPTDRTTTEPTEAAKKKDSAKTKPPSRRRGRGRQSAKSAAADQAGQTAAGSSNPNQSTGPTAAATSVSRGYKNTVVSSSAKQGTPGT